MPARRGAGARRDAGDRRRGQDARAGAAAVHAPRLLRQGVRRLHHAQVAERHRGAGRPPQLRPPRLRRDRAHQGQAGGGVPAHRVLRRHHRHGRPGRRVPEQRAVVPGRDRAPGRQGVVGLRRQQRPPGPQHHHCRPQDLLQLQGHDLEGHRRPIRKPHDRAGAMLLVRGGPAVQLHGARGAGPGAEQDVRRGPAAAVRAGPRQRHEDGGDGPVEPLHLRPELLPRRVQQEGPLHLRPDAARRQVDPGVRGADGRRGVAGGVLPRLRGGHDQHGPDRGAHGRQRGDQGGLHRVC